MGGGEGRMRELKVGDWVRVVDWPGDSPILGMMGQVRGKSGSYWRVRPEPEVFLMPGLREWLCRGKS
jgi:hypothetical protein